MIFIAFHYVCLCFLSLISLLCTLQNAGSPEPWTGNRDDSVWADRRQGWLPHSRGLFPGKSLHRTHCR